MAYTPTDWQNLPNTTTPITANALNNMETGIKKSDTVIGGDEYDSTSTYEIGDFCIYNNKLYRCITAISTAEAFTPAHWEETSVNDELDALRKSGGIPSNSVIGYDDITVPSGFQEVDINDYINDINVATTTTNGLMSSSDKTKLDNILKKYTAGATMNLNSMPNGICVVNGWNPNLTNAPASMAWGILIQSSTWGDAVTMQILIAQHQSATTPRVFVRKKEEGNWGSWKTLS